MVYKSTLTLALVGTRRDNCKVKTGAEFPNGMERIIRFGMSRMVRDVLVSIGSILT